MRPRPFGRGNDVYAGSQAMSGFSFNEAAAFRSRKFTVPAARFTAYWRFNEAAAFRSRK